MKRIHQKLSAVVLILGLLFSQWAVATYVCAMPASSDLPMSVETADMRSMDCGNKAEDRSMLCVKHCEDAQTNTQTQPSSADLWLIAAPLFLLRVVAHGEADPRFASSPSLSPRQTSPPPLLLSRRFRI